MYRMLLPRSLVLCHGIEVSLIKPPIALGTSFAWIHWFQQYDDSAIAHNTIQ